MLKSVKPVWFLCLLLLAAFQVTNSSALADTGSSSDTSDTDMPSYQLSGWFFDSTTNPFPATGDPSLEWTSDDNIALIDHYLAIVADMYTDPSSGDVASSTDALSLSNGDSSVVPEPATLSLFCAGAALLGFGAFRRSRKAAVQQITHAPEE